MAAGTIATSSSDERVKGLQGPVARLQFPQVTFVTGAGHAAKTADLEVNGKIVRMDVIIAAVTGNSNLTTDVAITDENGSALGNELDHTTLAHGTSTYYDSESSTDGDADFNAVYHNGTLTVSVDPNEDTGGTLQTLAVDVILYVV